MDNQSNDWRSAAFRQNMVEKINEALQNNGLPKSASEIENTLFSKSQSHDEYRTMVAKLILQIQNHKNKKQTDAMDPINALQNLTNQGTRNPIPAQMMAMGNQMNMANNPNANPNVIQNLINQRAGQGQMQPMPNIRGVIPNAVTGNVMANTMSNSMPNAMNAMNANNMNMNMVGNVGQQVSNPPGQMMNNMVGQMNPMQMNMQSGQIMNMPMGMNATLPQNQMNAGQQMNTSQMSQMLNRINSVQNIGQQNASNVANQMNQAQMPPQMMTNANIPANLNQPNVANIPNIQNISNAPNPSNVTGPNVVSGPNVVGGPNVSVPNVGGPAQLQGTAQMNTMNQMNPMMNMQHMPRNQPANVLYQGIRNPTPNQPFFRKSPSPSVPSPMSGNLPTQMVPSPLVPSPQVTNIMSRTVTMAPSPSNTNLNTPGQVNAAPSPLNPQEEHLYREKYRQLTKYIEPLKKMMARMGSDDEKLLKMNKLLEILCNPNQRIPLETLIKCEAALEKMDLKSYSMASTTATFPTGSKEHNVNAALLDAVSANLQSPIGNHTLQRTFRPCIESLFGPDIKNLPQNKCPRISASENGRGNIEIPHVLQGEIARLDKKFRITHDSTVQTGSKILKLMCHLNDPYLPSVPPIFFTIPEDYPSSPPSCMLLEHEMNATQFLETVQKIFSARMLKMPTLHSLSHIVDTWEMSIRQACSPNNNMNSISTTSVTLGV